MCLAVPAKVIELKEKSKKAVVEQAGVQKEVLNIANAKKGEFVLIQQGIAVEKIPEKEARKTLEELRQHVLFKGK